MKCPKCDFENPADSDYCSKCGTQISPSDEITISPTKTLQILKRELIRGATLANRYEIIEELGEGGMGKVYRVVDKKINEEVALKLLDPEIAADKKMIERFSNELKFARKITHKNVCRMHDIGEEEGTHYITMEYVSGEDLKSFIRRGEKLNVGKAISIAKQVCSGLAEAHKLGVIHRDLKPQNIMIDREGKAKVMDFGIARSIEAKGVTEAGMVVGTPDYMSPEQVEGEEADQRSDIYSLGVVLYEMVTGRAPFEGKTPLSIALKHKTEIPLEPRKLNAQIPEDLNRLILRCMTKDKEKRYQGAEELLSDLSRIEEGIPTGERVLPRRKPFPSKEITVTLALRKLFIPALVVIALAIVGIAIWRISVKKELAPFPSGKPTLAVMYFDNQSDEQDLDKILVDMLARNLSRYQDIDVVSSQRLYDILKQIGKQDAESIDKKVATEVANRAEVKTMLVGSIIKIGAKIRITSELTDVQTGAIIGSEQAEGTSVNDVFEMADELTAKLGVSLGASTGEKGQPLKIADVTTNSYEAYNYFLRGRDEYERLLHPEAQKFLKKAVEIDPTFAAAYLYLSYVSVGEERNEALEKAMSFREKASDKERLFIEAAHANFIERNQEKRYSILQQMEKKYPKDKYVHAALAGYYSWEKGQLDKAIEECHKTLELDPNFKLSIMALANIYAKTGEYEKSLEYNRRYASVSPGDPNPLDNMGELYFNMGKLDEAIAKYKEAIEVKPDWGSDQAIAYIYALKENYSEAMKWIDENIAMAASSGRRATGFMWKGFYHYWLGSPGRSLAEIHKAEEIGESLASKSIKARADWLKGWIHYERSELELSRNQFKSWFDIYSEVQPQYMPRNKAAYSFYLGLLDLKQGRIDSAKARLAEIKSLLPNIFGLFEAYITFQYDLLNGEVLLAEDSLEKAIGVFEKASTKTFRTETPFLAYGSMTLYNAPFLNDVLARAYQKKGEIDKAIAEYERLITFDPDGKDRRLIHPKYHYRLAKLYEEKGWKGKAIEQYEKFLEIWKDADEGHPEVPDARNRLSELRKLP